MLNVPHNPFDLSRGLVYNSLTTMRPMRCVGRLAFLLTLSCASTIVLPAFAAPYFVGPKACQECHKAEYDVWEKTKHSASFKDLHRHPKANDILAAAGGEKNIRRNTLCTQCHYTLEQADESSAA